MEKFKNILVSRTDKIGDVILTLPLISEIKRILPHSKVSFLISKRLGDLIQGYKGIDYLYYVEDYDDNLVVFFKSKEFDTGINVFPRKDIAVSMFRAGINTRVGSAYRFFSFLYNRRIKEHRKYALKHEADYNLNLLSFLNKEISYDKEFHFNYTPLDFNNVKMKLQDFEFSNKFIIIHPGSKGSAKDLPLYKLLYIAEFIITKYPHNKVVLTGSDEDKPIINLFKEKFNNNVIDVSGILTLRELMIFIDKCELFISNSTGPVHIAGALNKNIIGFYPVSPPMNAVRWRPLSKNAVIISPETGDYMGSIPEKTIELAIEVFLNSSNI